MADEKDKVRTVEEIAEGINKSIETLKASVNEKADLTVLEQKYAAITAKLDKLVDKDGKPILPDALSKQQEQLDEISTQLKQLGEFQDAKGKSVAAQIFEKVKSDEFKAKVKAFSGRGEIASFDVTRKASDINTADINAGVIETQTDPGVSAAPWRPNPIWDAINKGVIGAGRDSISWWEETTRTDNAAMVGEEAAPAAGSAKTWTKQSMDIKMIKDFTKVTRSALEDWDYITSEINDLIGNGIPRERESQLYNGTGLTVYLKGITQYAKTFAKPANFDAVYTPNSGDVLAAAILQANNGNVADANKRGYNPNIVMLNPGDMINMRLLKDGGTPYRYLTHPLLSADGTRFGGVLVVPNLDMTAGTFLVGDFSRAKAYIKRTMRISFHYENENDVLNDLVLVLASERIAGLKVTAADAFGFVTGTFAAGITAITKV